MSSPNKKSRKRSPSPSFRNPKAKGDWAEIAFLAKATSLDLAVCKPYGDNHPFDCVTVTRAGKMARVQIKSAWGPSSGETPRRYWTGPGPMGYDFFVAYVPPHDAWYVIPECEMGAYTTQSFLPHVPGSKSKYEKYRDCWHFLTGEAADDTRSHGLTIHACADPEYA